MLATAYRNAITAEAGMSWLDAFLVSTTATAGSAAALCALYVTKSALGINLMPGPSPLHDVLYWLVL